MCGKFMVFALSVLTKKKSKVCDGAEFSNFSTLTRDGEGQSFREKSRKFDANWQMNMKDSEAVDGRCESQAN